MDPRARLKQAMKGGFGPNKPMRKQNLPNYYGSGPSPTRKITGSGSLDIPEIARNQKINKKRRKAGLSPVSIDD